MDSRTISSTNELVLVLQLSPNVSGAEVTQLYSARFSLSGNDVSRTTRRNESREEDFERLLKLSPLPANISDQQGGEFSQRRALGLADEDKPVSSQAGMASKVRTATSPYVNRSLRIVLERRAGGFG